MNSGPTTILKIPYGAYKAANEMGLVKSLLFYLQVKTINIEGFLKLGSVIPLIQQKTGLGQAQIRRNLTMLENLNWGKKEKGSFSLAKYDKVWSSLGFDPSNRKHFRLFRIECPSYLIEEAIWRKEITANINTQNSSAALKHVKKELLQHADTDRSSKDHKLVRRLIKNVDLRRLYDQNQKKAIRKNAAISINYDQTLSCRGVAHLLGFKAASKGYKIEQRLKELNWLEVKRRVEFVRSGVSREEFRLMDLPTKYRFIDGNIICQLPNLLLAK